VIFRFRIGPTLVQLEAATAPHDPDNLFFRTFADTSLARPDLILRIHPGAAPLVDLGVPVYELADHWRLARVGEGWRLEILEQMRLEPRIVALIDPGWSRITVYDVPLSYSLPTAPHGGWSIAGVMDPLVQWWMTARLAVHSKGLVFHAAAISLNGRGAAFIGRSGAGKSTLAGWCHDQAGLTVLNDERIIVWNENDQWFVSGTPWSGDLAQASGLIVPLARLHLLVQAPTNEFRPLSPRQALFRLLEEASMPTWSAELNGNTVASAAKLLTKIPCGELLNQKNPSIVDFLRHSLREPVGVA
jgi:hypothetical protein